MHNFTQFSILLQYLLLGEEASPSIWNTLWHVSTMFTRSAITPPEVNGFGWNLGNSAGHERFWVWSAPKREQETLWKFCFWSAKQRTTLPISGQPNFTKFAHKTWFYVRMNPVGKMFWKFAHKGSFFQKTLQFCLIRVNDFRLQVTNLGKSWQVGAPVECWLFIYTVGMNSKWFPWPVTRAQKCKFQSPVSAEFKYLKRRVRRLCNSVSNPRRFA